ICVCLGENLMDTPGFWISLKHLGVTLFRNEQMSASTMIEDVYVVRSERCSFVQSVGRFLAVAAFERDDANPHPSVCVFWREHYFLAECGERQIQMVAAVLSNSKKQICAAKLWF